MKSRSIFNALFLTLALVLTGATIHSFASTPAESNVTVSQTLADNAGNGATAVTFAFLLGAIGYAKRNELQRKFTETKELRKQAKQNATPALLMEIALRTAGPVAPGSGLPSSSRGAVTASTPVVATGTRGTQTATVFPVIPEITVGATLNYTYTTSGAYTKNALIPLVPQLSTDTLPTGCTFSGGNFANIAAFIAFYSKISVMLGDLQVTTDNVLNFDDILKITTTNADGSSTSRTISFNTLDNNPQNYNQNVRKIKDTVFITGSPLIRYEIGMEVSSNMSFVWQIRGVADSVAMRQF